jgi:hypothetical protein
MQTYNQIEIQTERYAWKITLERLLFKKHQMMQDNTPINFYIKHFFINCQIKKLQPIFDTFVPSCILQNN